MTKPKKTSEIEWELIGATKLRAKAGEDREVYLRRMMDAIKGLGDDDWDGLSEEAQLWYNTNIAKKKDREPLLDFDGDEINPDGDPAEEPAKPEGEPAADHEEGAEDPEPEPEINTEDEHMSTTKKTAKKDKSAKKATGKKAAPVETKKAAPTKAANKTSLKAPKPVKVKVEKPVKVKVEKPARSSDGKRPHTDVNRAVEIMIPMVAKDASLSEMQKALDKAGAEIAVTTMRACASWIRRVCNALEKKGMLRSK